MTSHDFSVSLKIRISFEKAELDLLAHAASDHYDATVRALVHEANASMGRINGLITIARMCQNSFACSCDDLQLLMKALEPIANKKEAIALANNLQWIHRDLVGAWEKTTRQLNPDTTF